MFPAFFNLRSCLEVKVSMPPYMRKKVLIPFQLCLYNTHDDEFNETYQNCSLLPCHGHVC